MAQHDQVVNDDKGLPFRNDLNAALAALFSSSSGAVEPSVKVAGQLWFNTTSGQLVVRNTGNTDWQSLTGTMDGTINVGTVNNFVEFTGTTPSVGVSLLNVRDNRVTVGAEGNAVLGVKRQNSATDALIFGNDANNAGLIGANNTPLRFGKWVSGVFTEYLNMSTAGAFTLSGGLVIDPPSAVMGLQIGPSDAHSGRLFFTSTAHNWSVTAWDTDGTLRFSSGGTYGTSTGTARVLMYETGMLSVGNLMDAIGFQVSSGFNGTRRGFFQAKTSAGTGVAYVQSFDDTGTEDARLEVANSTFTFRSMGTQPTSQVFRLSNAAGQRRIDMYWDANNGLVLYARDAAGAAIGHILIDNAGVLKTYDGTTTSDVLTTGNYPAAATASTVSTVAQRDTSGDINARLFRSEYDTTNPTIGFIMTQIDTVSNNFIRPSTPAQVATALDGLVSAEVYTGSTNLNTTFPIGTCLMAHDGSLNVPRCASHAIRIWSGDDKRYVAATSGTGASLAGTWRARGSNAEFDLVLFQRTA
ncbi:phage tail protein [Sinorhizobium fredii]|uniref:phage tail protein n=1 Tax=Rhizobium fredii TaxID=380 RepID=UPI00309AAE6D